MQYDEFRTAVAVAAGIMNRRPLTRFSTDPKDLRAISPMTFLAPGSIVYSSNSVLPATPLSGSLLRRSKDSLRPIMDSLWKRWRLEYVSILQKRTKWITQHRNLQPNDLVLMTDETAPREYWPLALVTHAFPDEQGIVRRVRITTSTGKDFERDIRNLVLLEREGEGEVARESRDAVPSKAGVRSLSKVPSTPSHTPQNSYKLRLRKSK